MKKQVVLYLINIILLFASLIVAITGIIKFPGLFTLLNIDPYLIPLGILTWLHDWLGLVIVVMTIIHLALNWGWIKRMTKRLLGKGQIRITLYILACVGFITLTGIFFIQQNRENDDQDNPPLQQEPQNKAFEASEIPEISRETLPGNTGTITIDNVGEFNFPVEKITTYRPDIFNPGYFSVFDILVYLDEIGQIDLSYFYSEEMKTHLITGINGVTHWWYIAYYDGGWTENNVWPIDLFPYKEKMTIRLIEISPEEQSSIYATFTSQSKRVNAEKSALILPEVIINGQNETLTFENVAVSAHNLRNDYFVDGTITAIDVILSLGDQHRLTYKLKWYESVGSAGVVKNYFVDGINEDVSAGRCGFVYELGETLFYGFRGNHIHIPSDHRVIQTVPAYVEFFWICI